MYISINKCIEEYNDFKCYETDIANYYYKGVLYISGHLEGLDSLKQLAFDFENDSINYLNYKGSFLIVIKNKNSNEIVFFSDNSNMNCFYITEKDEYAISDSFLRLLTKGNSYEFDSESIYEYLSYGNIFWDKTLIEGIRITSCEKYYILKENKIIEIDKEIGSIDANTSLNNPQVVFDDIAYAFKQKKMILSLTGGYDSRMVFACLNKNMKIDTFISGDNLEDEDIIISKKVAQAVHNNHFVINIKKPCVTSEYLYKYFIEKDGMRVPISDGGFRIYEFMKELKNKGYDVLVTGDAGTLHKDWYWIEDFPFYNKKTVNVNRFMRHRIAPKHKIPFGEKLKKYDNIFENKMIGYMESIKKSTNSTSYDMFTWKLISEPHYKTNMNSTDHILTIYSPLLELDLVRYSYNLPRKKRAFYNYMRDMISNASSEIAKIKTIYGTTASNSVKYIIRDIFAQMIDYVKRVIRFLGRRFMNKSIFNNNPSTWTCESEIVNSTICDDALKLAIESGWIDEDYDASKLSYELKGKLIHLYLLDYYLKLKG